MSQDHRLGPHLPEDVFIARMKRERQLRGWSQERLAAAVEDVSRGRLLMHPTAFTKLERESDRRNLRLNEAHFIAAALGLTVPRMLTDDDLEGTAARIRDLQQQHRALLEELQEADRRHNEITNALGEIGAEVARLREAQDEETPIGKRSELVEVEVLGPVDQWAADESAPAAKATVKPHKAYKAYKETKTTTRDSRRG